MPSGRRGILQGGSAYGCCFTGGAENNFFTFTSLTQPSGRGLLSALSPFVVVAWVVGKNLALSVVELAKALPALPRAAPRRRGLALADQAPDVDLGAQFLHHGGIPRSLRGVPAIYVNYLGYDETAHAFGPRSRARDEALRGVDARSSSSGAVMRRVPEHRYDAYILSDHGQTPCTPYRDLTKGRRLERWIFDEFLHPAGAESPRHPDGLRDGLRDAPARNEGHAAAVHELPRRGLLPPTRTRKRTSRTACARSRPGRMHSSTCSMQAAARRGRAREALSGASRKAVAQSGNRLRACPIGQRRQPVASGRATLRADGARPGPFAGRAGRGAGLDGRETADADAERRRPRDLRRRRIVRSFPSTAHTPGRRRTRCRPSSSVRRASRCRPVTHPVELYAHFMRYSTRWSTTPTQARRRAGLTQPFERGLYQDRLATVLQLFGARLRRTCCSFVERYG